MSVSTLAVNAEEDEKIESETSESSPQSSKDRDERMQETSLVLNLENAEVTDSAIISLKTRYRYSREELLKLRQLPLSQVRPEHLSVAFGNTIYSPGGNRDSEVWHRNRSETPNENGIRTEEIHKRRQGDPRERIRKEQDGIVLSPQRRSFNSGCFVPLKENQRTNRQHSPIGKTEPHIVHREIPQNTRRIGSGRILSRDVPWDFQEKQEIDSDFGYRREDRFDRRFGRDFDKDKEKHGGRNRYGDGRRRVPSDNRDEEPEWFSGGPLSQADTIELRGFDDNDSEKLAKKKISNAQKKRLKDRGSVKAAEQHQVDAKDKDDEDKPATPATSENAPPVVDKQSPTSKKENSSIKTETDSSFNFDDILKCDTIANLLPNGVSGDEGETSGSRFSRWFKRESPIEQMRSDSHHSSFEEDYLIRDLLNDIAEPNVSIPTDPDLYFAPISPAANTGGGNMHSQKSFNLMEMLQKSKSSNNMKNLDGGCKIFKLAELEARMLRQGAGDMNMRSNVQQTKQSSKSHEDPLAFKQLLAQASGSQPVPVPNGPLPVKGQSMSILEMLSNSQQQDEAARLASSQIMGPSSPNAISAALNNDLVFKLQQVQNHVQAQQRQQTHLDMVNKLINANMHRQQLASPLHEISLNQSRELLNRPEAQAILQGLKRGDITSQHLYQQLAANPAMQPRHRELLLTILKLHGGGGTGVGPSPRVLSPVPPHPLFQQQQQQLRVSPLPTGIHQRIPSPRELQVHTQNIMQQALIKKKLEEQTENYKKRQELQRGQSPGRGLSPAKHISSPTPLAFTPTSVLRKMTADKDDSSKDSSKSDIFCKIPAGRAVTGMKTLPQSQPQTWNMQLKQPVGRPIVKANANLQTPQDQFYQQQQRIFNQQQRKLGQQYPSVNHSQSGSSSHSQQPIHFSSYSSNPQQFQQQFTQHQLRAQHQQHQPPQQSNQYNNRSNSQLWSHQHHTLLTGSNYDGRISHIGGERGANASNNGGDLSPTSNQLARWFSPELLERARAGKVPNLPSTATAQHAISLEELERQTAPPVHN